ncbi:Kinesin- protein 6, partial [Coemansia spiralis]
MPPGNGIPRATPAASFSPPMQPLATSDARTVGRQGIPPPGRPGLARPSRRQTIAPSSQVQGGSRIGDGGLRAMASRPGGGRGPRPSVSNMSEILERSNAFSQSQQIDANSDDELERVVRKPGQSSLVNAYGIPVRPTTGHVKRSTSERRSLAPAAGGLRPKTAHRTTRSGEGGREMPSNLNDKIRVCVRKRPVTNKEKAKGEKDIVQPTGPRSLAVMEPKVKVDMTKYIEESRFTFDEVFAENADNTQVYERTAKPLVEYIFGGGNATCFAYGQTGSGKTYTMMDTHNGLYIQAAEDLFALLRQPGNQHLQAFVTFYEIYLANLFDLLNDRKKLFAREDASQNVCIQGVREVLIQSPEDLMSVFEYGHGCRSTGSTGANSDSSRSHAILQIALKDMSGRRAVQHGKLSFIDLAGNERGADRGDSANKQTMMEGAEINKSLLALKECIRALDLNKRHQPFRQSKLTQVLKDSFIGNSRACMIATISPNTANSDNTLNTLRYADR